MTDQQDVLVAREATIARLQATIAKLEGRLDEAIEACKDELEGSVTWSLFPHDGYSGDNPQVSPSASFLFSMGYLSEKEAVRRG